MQNFTDGNTMVCGLIGNPVRHTMSPLIHNTLSRMTNINLVYVPFEVQEKDVAAAIKGAEALNIQGLNVTIPYKSDVISYLEEIDPLAEGIGAVNTLVRTSTGGFKGYNTDMTGLYRAMTEEGIDLKGETIVILGAGGVVRPVAYLCASKGARKVYILNRTVEKAREVAESTGFEDVVEAMALTDYKALLSKEEKFVAIQGTSVGMFPDVNSSVIEDNEFFKHVSVAIDLVYRPLETRFLELARQNGARTFSGLKMLLYQGIDAFELWNQDKDGNSVAITREQSDEIYRALVLELTGASNIILEGFMGSGKSTVARIIADKLEMELMDTDKAIEDMSEITISEIFEKYGEEDFRDCETNLISYLLEDRTKGLVLSLGGGLPLREKNRGLIKELGKVIYLKTSPEAIYDRVKGDSSRPLLQVDDPKKKIKELLDEREGIYEDAADIVVDTDGKNPEEIADEIIKMLGF